MKKKILQVGLSENKGGIEVICKNLSYQLEDEYIFDFIQFNQKKIAFENYFLKNGSKIYRVLGTRKMVFKYYFYLIKFFIKFRGEYQAIHFNVVNLYNIDLIVLSKLFGWKNIIIHARNSKLITNKKRVNFMHKINRNIILFFADSFIACSKEAGKFMFNSKIKYEVIYNAVDTNKFKYNIELRKKIRREYYIENKTVIGHIGTFSEFKNHKFIIEIFEEFLRINSESILFLIGKGKLKNKIIRELKNKKIEDKVIFLEETDYIENYMNSFDLFLFPSKSEGFGNVLLEAQCSGLRSLVSLEGIIEEINITGLVNYFSLKMLPKDWSQEIVRILSSNVRKDYSYILENKGFSLKKFSKKIKKYYN